MKLWKKSRFQDGGSPQRGSGAPGASWASVSPCHTPPHEQFFVFGNPSRVFVSLDTLVSTKPHWLLALPVSGLCRQARGGARLAVPLGCTARPRGQSRDPCRWATGVWPGEHAPHSRSLRHCWGGSLPVPPGNIPVPDRRCHCPVSPPTGHPRVHRGRTWQGELKQERVPWARGCGKPWASVITRRAVRLGSS